MLTGLRRSKVYTRLHRHEIVRQFVKYAMVGAVNTVMFFTLFNVLDTWIHTVAAYAVAFFSTSVWSFALNKFWSFRDHRTERIFVVRQYVLFAVLTLAGLALNTGAFRLALIPLAKYGRLGKNAAALCTSPLSILWNFTAYRRWIFKAHPRATSTLG